MNKALVNQKFEIPKEILKKLQISIQQFGHSNIEGSKRSERLVKEKVLSYGQIKRLIHDMKYLNKDENRSSYELNGGKEMEDWANRVLDDARNQVRGRKDSQMRANEIGGLDGIRKNAHLDTHTKKDNNQLGDILKGSAENGGGIMSSTISEEIKRINQIIKSKS